MRWLMHKVGHCLWFLAYHIDRENTPTYPYCECRSDKEELQKERDVW